MRLHRNGGTIEVHEANAEEISDGACREFAALPDLGPFEFEQLTGYPIGGDDLFVFDQKGVRSREYSDHELALLDAQSRSEVLEAVRHRLDFPCTPAQLVQFVDAVSWFFGVPEAFRSQVLMHQVLMLGQEAKGREYPNAPSITVHNSKKRRHILDHELDLAIKEHGAENDAVWSALTKAAEQKDKRYPALVGVVAEGIQYRGGVYDLTGEPDVLTRKQCGERLRKRRDNLKKTPNG